ncbi:hypothetical protein MMC17_002565 [Xylographa soralifera]|nr:hypothetical protein [Xylographa soralifera]
MAQERLSPLVRATSILNPRSAPSQPLFKVARRHQPNKTKRASQEKQRGNMGEQDGAKEEQDGAEEVDSE